MKYLVKRGEGFIQVRPVRQQFNLKLGVAELVYLDIKDNTPRVSRNFKTERTGDKQTIDQMWYFLLASA